MHRIVTFALALASLCLAAAAPAQPSATEKERERQLTEILQSLHPVSGDVIVPEASAVLHLGKDYYYLPADEARRVIVDAWGNPPEMGEGVLGMVFPAGKTFLDDVWGAVITYEPTGYVSDEDASTADYDALLKDMQASIEAGNEQRTKMGYPAEHLVGWAQAPRYDPRTHSVVWARNVSFDGQADNSLNYDVRLLGRRGVLSLNMVTVMSKLDETRAAADKFAGSAEFQSGSRYADFQPGDRKAEYGVAGLIAAGAGVAAAKKLGILGVILAFGKKFLVVILAVLAGLGAWFRRLLNRGGDKEAEYGYEPAAYAGEPAAHATEPTAAEAPVDPVPPEGTEPSPRT